MEGYPGMISDVKKKCDEERALRFTAVFAAMRLRAENIASLPKTVRIKKNNLYKEAVDHPVYKLLTSTPNRFQNIFSFWEFVNFNLDGWGNSYVIIKRNSKGIPNELIPVHSSVVTIKLKDGHKFYKILGTKFYDGTYDDYDMLHFFAMSKDGIVGINPIEFNSDAINTGIEATSFGNEFFSKKGNLKAVIETDQFLSDDQYNNISTRVAQNHGTPILEGGLKYHQLTLSPESAQMLETKTYSIQDIARIFNVPPHLLSDLSRSTFSNIEHQDIQFVKYSLRPAIKRYETELEKKLFFDDERGYVSIDFNLEGLLRGDTNSRGNYYQKAITNGWLSRNEVREIENLNPIKGLDDYMYPGNELIVGKKMNKVSDTRKIGKDVHKTRTIQFVFSDSTRDSYHTVLTADNWLLDRFNKNGIAFYQHQSWSSNPDLAIGTARAWVEDGKLLGEITFEKEEVNPLAEKIFKKLLAGTLKAVSVGFLPLTRGTWGKGKEAIGEENETYYYGKCELLEISVVNIPANKNATVRSFMENPEEIEKKPEAERIIYRTAYFEEKENHEEDIIDEKEIEDEKIIGKTADDSQNDIEDLLVVAQAECLI
jgi:phage portal protein, HK97 family